MLATTDLSDKHPHIPAAEPLFNDYGGESAFYGPIKTLKVFEDNALVRATLETAGNGRVLVVDGGGSLRCALLGDQLAELAVKNHWVGVVVYGCIRDSAAISDMPLGVKALSTHPKKSEKGLHTGHADKAVTFAGLTFNSGDWLYADADGMLLSVEPLH
jgi:regulator of ribonuclease activity A